MSNIGHASFIAFLVLIAVTAAAFCLPSTYAWSWGVVIQLWALFGFMKLYHLGDAASYDSAQPRLSNRLMDSLKRRLSFESDELAGRLGRPDSLAVLLAGSLMVLCVLAGAYAQIADEASIRRALYITLYLAAQIFCLGVIAFLSQLYAARRDFLMIGFFACFALAATVAVYVFARYGLSAVSWEALSFSQGTDIYLSAHDGLSPAMLRAQAMGPAGAVLPWLAVAPMALPLIGQIFHPARGKSVAVFALCLMAGLGFYDLFAVRAHYHFLIVLPAWAALTLAWGRTGYGPLRTPWRARVRPPSAILKNF